MPRPSMIWTNPASLEPPAPKVWTSSESLKVTGPSKHFSVSAHHCPCSGRSLLALAAAAESKRARQIPRPSSATPAVDPKKPFAPGRRSLSQRSSWRRKPSRSPTRPSITCTNTVHLHSRPGCPSSPAARGLAMNPGPVAFPAVEGLGRACGQARKIGAQALVVTGFDRRGGAARFGDVSPGGVPPGEPRTGSHFHALDEWCLQLRQPERGTNRIAAIPSGQLGWSGNQRARDRTRRLADL